jgi:NADPH2:quinone reductase
MTDSDNGQSMRALVLEKIGADLVMRGVPRPEPGPGHILVRVAASGVNPLDTKIRAGAAAHAQVSVPAILGIDLAGTVVALGPGVTKFDIGDEVYGMVGGVGQVQGTLAQYAAVDADLLAIKPARLSMLAAAALPLAVITAWEGLVDRAGISAGDVVLVHGGAGGVGSVAVQLALAHGAVVYATGSPRSLDVIRSLGAEPIDRRPRRPTSRTPPADSASMSSTTRSAVRPSTIRSAPCFATPATSSALSAGAHTDSRR